MPAAKRFNAATRMKGQASRVCGFNSAVADSALARAAPSLHDNPEAERRSVHLVVIEAT
jgi:hypothetical protein